MSINQSEQRHTPSFLEELENATPEEAKYLLAWFDWSETYDPIAHSEQLFAETIANQDDEDD